MNRAFRAAAVLLVAATFLPGHAAEAVADANSDASVVVVIDNNIENMSGYPNPMPQGYCPGDWTDLVAWMRTQQHVPDVFLVQQLSDGAQARQLAQRMTDDLHGTYAAIVAVESPSTANMNTGCSNKTTQTNAIIYRTGRFSLVAGSVLTWQSLHETSAGVCGPNDQDRSINVVANLRDTLAAKTVTVASLHWPTRDHGGAPCTSQNLTLTQQQVAAARATSALSVFGGDLNTSEFVDWTPSSAYQPWYTTARNQNADPVYDACSGASAVKQCLVDPHWTSKTDGGEHRRLDYLFAARKGLTAWAPATFRNTLTDTVSYENADAADTSGGDRSSSTGDAGQYSLHRAVRAYVKY